MGTTVTNGETGLQVYSRPIRSILDGRGRCAQIRRTLFGIEMASIQRSCDLGPLGLHVQLRILLLCGDLHPDVLPNDPHLPLALRADAAGREIEPATDELHRPELAKPYTLAAFVISGMYAGPCRWPPRCNGPAGGRRTHVLDRIRRGCSDDDPRRRRALFLARSSAQASSSTSKTSSRRSTTTSCTSGSLGCPTAWKTQWSG